MPLPGPGDRAPDFSLPSTLAGETGMFSLAAQHGRPVVLFFYPRDDTQACTREALDFTAALPDFRRLGVAVAGVSADSMQKHRNFVRKHGLKIPLVSDEGTDALQAWGVWVEKSMYGHTFMGIERSTFLIDASGIIAQARRKVRVAGHVAEVLDAARQLVSQQPG